MATAKAFGSISITDITDVGRISAYITSNLPLTVIENPNSSTTTYTPDWSKNKLTLTPVIYFNEKQLVLPTTGLNVTWQRQEGSGALTDLKSGETVKDGILDVTQNFLGTIQSGLLTYVVNVQYTDPNTNVTLETQARITFSLAKQATEAKYCSIQGESVFLYNASQTLVGTDTITLTASTTNVNVAQWQYKNADGSFVAIPTTNNPSITGNTIKIKATEDVIFNNDVAVIKLVTNDSSVYDLHTITKIRDGAAGNSTIAVVLSNEDHTLPCNSKGVVTSFVGALTTISVFEGGTDVTSKWSILYKESNVTGKFESNTYTASGLSQDVGYVEFTCTRSGYSNLIKRFTLTKQYAGVDGEDAVIYSIKPSTLSMNLNKDNIFNPTNVTFSSVKQIGASTSQSVYNGRFKIYESADGLSFGTAKYTSTSDEASKVYSPSNMTVRAIKCELYATGGTTNLLDSQTVIITKDGTDGTDGKPGTGGVSVIMGNEAEVIPCNSDGTVKVETRINIPFYGYIGTSRAAITCEPGTLPEEVTVTTNTAGTTSAAGLLTIKIPAGNTLGSASNQSGNFTLNFTCNGTTVEKKFSWTKNIQASNAVLLQIFAPQGDVIVNGKNNVVLNTQLTDGSTLVDSGVTYQWAKFEGGSYQNIPSQTQSSLTVTPSMVESMASFKCTATYGGKPYIAYWTVTDKNDSLELMVLCSVGTQLSEKSQFGAVYTLAYQNGIEVDPIPSTTFSTTPPVSAQTGDFYYHLDKAKKTVTLKKYSGSAWTDAPETPKGTYKYYRRSATGVELDAKGVPWKEGKVIYIDRDIIDGGISILCEADIPLS